MLAWLGEKLIATPLIGTILNYIFNFVLKFRQQTLDAQGAHEVQAGLLAAKSIALDQREAELNNQLLVAEQGNWMTRSVRPLMAFPVVVVLWKVLIYDKALGQWTDGHTDSLDVHLWWVMTTIIIAYMGGRSAEKVADKLAGIWRTK